jgi:hypothetical protein
LPVELKLVRANLEGLRGGGRGGGARGHGARSARAGGGGLRECRDGAAWSRARQPQSGEAERVVVQKSLIGWLPNPQVKIGASPINFGIRLVVTHPTHSKIFVPHFDMVSPDFGLESLDTNQSGPSPKVHLCGENCNYVHTCTVYIANVTFRIKIFIVTIFSEI